MRKILVFISLLFVLVFALGSVVPVYAGTGGTTPTTVTGDCKTHTVFNVGNAVFTTIRGYPNAKKCTATATSLPKGAHFVADKSLLVKVCFAGKGTIYLPTRKHGRIPLLTSYHKGMSCTITWVGKSGKTFGFDK